MFKVMFYLNEQVYTIQAKHITVVSTSSTRLRLIVQEPTKLFPEIMEKVKSEQIIMYFIDGMTSCHFS
jgi:hypothetical protein